MACAGPFHCRKYCKQGNNSAAYQAWAVERLLFICSSEQREKPDVFKFEMDNPESIDIQSGCFERKGLWECGGMVWQNGEQGKKYYR